MAATCFTVKQNKKIHGKLSYPDAENILFPVKISPLAGLYVYKMSYNMYYYIIYWIL